MLSLWVTVWALEVSPELHHLLHEDSQSPDHHCLVTQLQHNAMVSGFVPAVAPAAPAVWSILVNRDNFEFPPAADYQLPPSRAPPAV